MKYLLSFAMVLGCASWSYGAQTLQFNTASGRLTNIQNSAGSTAPGLQYGIIVSTTNATFAASGITTYDPLLSAVTLGQYLYVGGLITDDYYFPGSTTIDSTVFGGEGAPGTIASVTGVTYANGITQSDPFQLIWFSTNTAAAGDYYGVLNSGLLMPADGGGTTNFGATYVNADPARPANLQFAAVPEPSHSILVLLGLSVVVLRRRRKV